jgi:hypothetical protein
MTFDKSGREPAALVAYQGDNEWALAEIENALHLRPYGTISGPLDVMPAPATAAAAATAPTTRPANILLRRQDAQSRFDYLLDPARDYLCVRQVRYARHGQEWREESWSALSDLQQLPGGGSGWYGRQIVYFGTPFRASVEVLNDSDFPPDLFNGDKLIVELRRAGKSVTFNPW